MKVVLYVHKFLKSNSAAQEVKAHYCATDSKIAHIHSHTHIINSQECYAGTMTHTRTLV